MSASKPYNILLTGASGFLGSYIKSSLEKKGHKVIGIGRNSQDIVCDLGKEVPQLPADIDYIVHCAGKAHVVPKTKEEGNKFFEVNVQGTENLLQGIVKSKSPLKGIVFISTVAVYGASEGILIDENSGLNATDPYGLSKIETENKLKLFAQEHKISLCSLRLPLISGLNPPGNLGSMISAIKKGWYLSIGNANTRKSIVLAEDVAELIPEILNKNGTYNLSDGYHPTFAELEWVISQKLNKKKPLKIPQFIANTLAKVGDVMGKKSPINSKKLKKIQSELTFSDEKARNEIGWNPRKVIDHVNLFVE